MFSKNPMVQKIQDKIRKIIRENKKVSFLWVPSHLRIAGIEKYDKLNKHL